jgi:hypothetical protein
MSNSSVLKPSNEMRFQWITNPDLLLNQYLLSMLDGQGDENTLITPYFVNLNPPFQDSAIQVLQRIVISQGSLTFYDYIVRVSTSQDSSIPTSQNSKDILQNNKLLQTLLRYTQQLMYIPLVLNYEPHTVEEEIPEKNLVQVQRTLLALLQQYMFPQDYPFQAKSIHKVVSERFNNPRYYSFYPIVSNSSSGNINVEDLQHLENYHRSLPMGVGTIQSKLKQPPIEDGSTMYQPFYVDEDTLRDVQSNIPPRVIKKIVNKFFISDNPLAKHLLPKWADAHDYNFNTLLSMLTFVGKNGNIITIDSDVIEGSHENIFLDIGYRAEDKAENGWFIYTIPFTQSAKNPKNIIYEIAERYGFKIHDSSDKRLLDVPNTQSEVILEVSPQQQKLFTPSVSDWISNMVSSIYSGDNISLRSSMVLVGDWNRLINLSLAGTDYAKVWYAIFKAINDLASSVSSLDESQVLGLFDVQPQDICVLPDLSVRVFTWNPSTAQLIQEKMDGILENPQNIKLEIFDSLQDSISSRMLTSRLYPNTNTFSFVLDENKYIVVSDANFIVNAKDPKDRISPEDIQKKMAWEKIGVDWSEMDKIYKDRVQNIKKKYYIPDVLVQRDRVYARVKQVGGTKQFDLFSLPVEIFEKDPKNITRLEKDVKKLWESGLTLTDYGYLVFTENPDRLEDIHIKNLSDKIKNFEDLEQLVE